VLGIPYEIHWDSSAEFVEISHRSNPGTIATRHDFFSAAEKDWLAPSSMPTAVCSLVIAEDLPAGPSEISAFQFGGDKTHISEGSIAATAQVIDFDLFGSIFFLISRYEEAVVETRDNHDRFPSTASVLAKYDLLDRPIGNEYIELLWCFLKKLWPALERKSRTFRVLPSHDIDLPSAHWKPRFGTLRGSLGALRRGKFLDAKTVWKNSLIYAIRSRRKTWEQDPYDTINWIMDQSEAHGWTSAFYYIPQKTHPFDLAMPLQHPHVVDQWQRIAKRGHEIGIHPGYETFLSPDRIESGAALIRRQLNHLGIKQSRLGGRQHYLRWKSPETAIAWDAAELDYDSSLGFADRAGFRCGVCYEYPMYDLIHRRPLNLRQRPLIAMECTVIDDRYMGMGVTAKAHDYFERLKNECRKYRGDFTLLWHNTELLTEEQRDLYASLLRN